MQDLTSEAKGYDINFRYRGKVFHINSSRLDKTREKLKQFGIEIYQNEEGRCIYLPDERKAVGEIKALPEDLQSEIKTVEDSADLDYSFRYCTNSISLDLSDWDVSRRRNFDIMFVGCFSLEHLNLSSWDVSQGRTFVNMFESCKVLKYLNLSHWNVKQGVDFRGMFGFCKSLKSLDLSNWDVSKGKNFSDMFFMCDTLEFLNLSGWDLSEGEAFTNMFYKCKNLKMVKAESCNKFTIKKLKKLTPLWCKVVY